jgi:hypothetical protein
MPPSAGNIFLALAHELLGPNASLSVGQSYKASGSPPFAACIRTGSVFFIVSLPYEIPLALSGVANISLGYGFNPDWHCSQKISAGCGDGQPIFFIRAEASGSQNSR